jgi:hypothetical protein
MKTISLSNGETKLDCYLVVRNVTGLAEERGFRLYWTNDERYLTPALGLVTSHPFRTMRDAVAYGERQGWGKARRIAP